MYIQPRFSVSSCTGVAEDLEFWYGMHREVKVGVASVLGLLL